MPFADPRRAECVLVVDCGQSYTHAVPLVRDEVQWRAVKRLDIGGKMLTSLLKIAFSYKQWNMMEETYLTDKMKATSCFVAACANDREESAVSDAPHDWSFARFVEHFHDDDENDMVQHYVLPDYARPEDVADPATKFGYVMAGPGSKPAPAVRLPEDEAIDQFIAGTSENAVPPKNTEHQVLRLGQERYQLMENLFAPQRIGLEQGSLAELVAAAIHGVQGEFQELLWGNVVLVGGTAGAKGLRRRLYVSMLTQCL